MIKQFTGNDPEDCYVSPNALTAINTVDVVGVSQQLPHVYKWSSNIYWIFTATIAAVAATRTLSFFEYNSNTNIITWKGNITLSGTTIAGNKLVRGLRAFVYEHSSGTVSTSGTSTTITGDSTQFTTDRIAAGARIGFGSTDPTQITTWYEISSIASDTSLVINAAVDLSAGTSYVIEEIRLAVATTNATLQNGGIHLIKGLNYSTFTLSLAGTTISEASSTDNVRASYLLKDYTPATFTVTIAAPGVFTLNNHGFSLNDAVMFTTSGALPTGLTASTIYYVTSTSLTTNTFTVSATPGGAAITTTGTQSGTHTLHSAGSIVVMGLAVDDQVSATSHDLYFLNLDQAGYVRIHKYNMRAALTVSSGISYSAWSLRTNSQAITGTGIQLGNGRIFTTQHGTGLGVKSLYFATTTRIYRCPVASLTSGGSAWLEDTMQEVPPGTTNTNLTTALMSTPDYSSTLDRLIIPTSVTTRYGVYIAQYNSSNPQFEKIFGQTNNRSQVLATPSGAVPALTPVSTLSVWTEDGYAFACPAVISTTGNLLYVFPLGADGYYGSYSNQRVITPKLATQNATQLYRMYVNSSRSTGDFNIGFTPEPIRMYYRTTDFETTGSSWTQTDTGDLTSATPSDYIQFMFELDTLGEYCVPAKLYSVSCVYEDGSQDYHYEPSLTYSSAQNRIFAWRQSLAWGSDIPNLRIRLYNLANGLLIFDDDVDTSSGGTWEYSTNGTVWNAWDENQDTVGNYIRYTASSLPNNITVRALLTQA